MTATCCSGQARPRRRSSALGVDRNKPSQSVSKVRLRKPGPLISTLAGRSVRCSLMAVATSRGFLPSRLARASAALAWTSANWLGRSTGSAPSSSDPKASLIAFETAGPMRSSGAGMGASLLRASLGFPVEGDLGDGDTEHALQRRDRRLQLGLARLARAGEQTTSSGRSRADPVERQNPVMRPSTSSGGSSSPFFAFHSWRWCSGVTNRSRALGSYAHSSASNSGSSRTPVSSTGVRPGTSR